MREPWKIRYDFSDGTPDLFVTTGRIAASLAVARRWSEELGVEK